MNAVAGTNADRPPRARRARVRWRVVLVVLACVAAAAGAKYVRDRIRELPELRTVRMEKRDFRLTVGATGTIEPNEIAEVGAAVPGKIVAFGQDVADATRTIDVGSRVTQGTVLVQLDRDIYDVGLRKAIAARHLAEAEVVRLETQLRQASLTRQRADRLRETNSQSQLDQAITAHEMAQAELQIGRARLEQAAAEVAQAEINLARTSICAPIDGVIIDRRTNLGQNVGPGAPGLFLLARDLRQMRIRANVSESDIGAVFVGQPVTFSVDAYRDRQMTGHVEKILLNARVQSNFVTYDVLVAIDDGGETLLPNMTADVQFETAKREDAWLAPAGSLGWWPANDQIEPASRPGRDAPRVKDQDDPQPGSQAVVWVPSGDGLVRPVQVRVGIGDGVMTEIMGDALHEEMPLVVGTVKKTTLARIIPSAKLTR